MSERVGSREFENTMQASESGDPLGKVVKLQFVYLWREGATKCFAQPSPRVCESQD